MFFKKHNTAIFVAAAVRRFVKSDTVICAIPGGSVLLGCEVAESLGLPIEVISVRSLYNPIWSERMIGSVSEDGIVAISSETRWIDHRGMSEYVHQRAEEAKAERGVLFAFHPQIALEGRPVILIDKGDVHPTALAAATHTLRARGASNVIIAAPVLSDTDYRIARELADRVVALGRPPQSPTAGDLIDDLSTLALSDIVGSVAMEAAA